MHYFGIAAVIGLAIAAALVSAGLMRLRDNRMSNFVVQPSILPSLSPAPSPANTEVPELTQLPPSIIPTKSPFVFRQPTSNPSPKIRPTESPLSISFVDLPRQIESGTPIIIKWRIDGPKNQLASDSSLQINYQAVSSSDRSYTSVSNKSRQSFGSVPLSHTFSTQLTLSGPGSQVNLVAEASVEGKKVRAERIIQLIGG